MAANSEQTIDSIFFRSRELIMNCMDKDATSLKPDISGTRGPLTHSARIIFRVLIYHFEDSATGLCNLSIDKIASMSACSQTSVKVGLKALRQAGYLDWKPGERKLVLTSAGYRRVKAPNRYRIFCPFRHIPDLRRALIMEFGRKFDLQIQKVIALYTPPIEETQATSGVRGQHSGPH